MLALPHTLDIVERIENAGAIASAAEALFVGLAPFGALSLVAHNTRISPRRPGTQGTPPVIAMTPLSWRGSAAGSFAEIHNPNAEAARHLRRPFLWREARLPTRALQGAYWEALGEFGGVDGLAVGVHEPGGGAGVSLGFATNDWSPGERRAMEFVCYAFVTKLREFSPQKPDLPKLTARERDCLAFVAEGKTDWEISVILAISHHTVRQYVHGACRKLDATTRAQAVATFLILGLI